MNHTIKELLKGNTGDYIFPFFWQHGEDEATLRKMMNVIHDSGCKSVCIESRPHPDFCGERWWTDMDILIDEAKKLDMKLWILDDSHFPTGFANGAVKNAPLELHRQSLLSSYKVYKGKAADVTIDLTKLFPPKISAKNFAAMSATKFMSKGAPVFDDDRILSVSVLDENGGLKALPIGNTGKILWHKPEGTYTVYVVGLSRNFGIHREYINMMSKDSCRILIDTVYETHYEHYKDEFGKTILGFFSDEPELGNGFYMTGANGMGNANDLPYSDELEEELKKRLGEDWENKLLFLWDGQHPELAAKVRLEYMDAVTKLVRKDFSEQIGDWCREHGVKYIGHLIEDNNSHTKTGMSLGHYFRGLNGQDMAGIDDIGGQVLPQGEDLKIRTFFGERDGEFYHFALGNLAASAAAIEVKKNGDSMCEIFGNYGWSEGLRLEKYLADHFMVNGINHFVPHAFTGKEFPDPDCPPHFYAMGHNPQYRHFRTVIDYMNRVCTLISGGHRNSKVAVLYNAEAEWMGPCMQVQEPLRRLYEAQILADTIPADVFFDRERYNTKIEDKLTVNEQEYEVLIVPKAKYIEKKTAEVLENLPVKVLYIDSVPEVPGEGALKGEVVGLNGLASVVSKYAAPVVDMDPASTYIKALDYTKEDRILYLVNEAAETYRGKISLEGKWYEYDALQNKVYRFEGNDVTIEPLKSLILIQGEADEELLSERIEAKGEKHALNSFERSVVAAIDYPAITQKTTVSVPDDYAKTDKYFSGIIRYEKTLELSETKKTVLEITDAYEGVEVFVNGVSLGIQIVPKFLYDLTPYLKTGENKLVIEVATTLERQMAKDFSQKMRGLFTGTASKLKDPTGINGEVYLYTE
ncbi:MAG: hypothetical protein IIZ28_06890 [Erysipelotrichaceae bacterium]|nr:hypothetical protein [Erysipelotrichaceae bacterium]